MFEKLAASNSKEGMRKESEENEGLTRYHQGDNKTRILPTHGENQNSFQVSARE